MPSHGKRRKKKTRGKNERDTLNEMYYRGVLRKVCVIFIKKVVCIFVFFVKTFL